MPSEIEKLFYNEVRSKKRTGSNIFSRASTRRGGSGTVYFTSDLLRGKEKREYRKAGKVTVSNMYEKILTRAEFDELTEEEQKNRLKYWRENYTIKEVQKAMGVASATFYGYIDKLGLKKQRLARGQSKKKTTAQNKAAAPTIAKAEPEQQAQQHPQVLVLNGLNIAYNGTYEAEEIKSMLNKIDLLLDGENKKFTIELKLMQN